MRSLVVLAVIVVMGCRAAMPEPEPRAGSQAGSTATFRVLSSGSYGKAASDPLSPERQRTPVIHIARSAGRYLELWQQHIGSSPAPPVDFDNETAIFLLLGLKSTGGYSIEPQSVRVSQSSAQLEAKVNSPEPGAFVTMAFTSPFAVIAVATPRLERVEWVERGRILARTELSVR